jgi:type IV secretory pathway VirB3-like protein
MIEDQPADRDKLAIPDTRPNFLLFIPYELAILLGMLFFAIDTQMHSMVKGFIVVPFWLLAAALVRRDVNGVRVFMVRARLALMLLDVHRWGGLSASPWPLKVKRSRRAV